MVAVALVVSTGASAKTISGKYRCWSMNTAGYGGGRCTSPALVLNPNGTYTMGSESGTYSANGDIVNLSQSKIRGPGHLKENDRQIIFQYKYKGHDYTMTYLLMD